MPFNTYNYDEPDQYKDDRRIPVPCSVCHGTEQIRFDFINKEPKTINSYTFKPGVNVTYRACPACTDPDEPTFNFVQPPQVTYGYEVPPPSVIYGECRRCEAEGEIDCNGYCFNC